MKIFALLCVFFGGMGQGVVNPKLPELLTDHSTLALDSGISASLMYIGIFFASFLYGRWADRGRVFRLMSTGLFIYAVVLILLAAAQTKTQLFLLRFFEGIGLSAVYVAADVVLCRGSSDDTRGRWLSYYGAALSLGLLLGPVLMLILEFFGVQNALAHSLHSLAGAALLSAIVSLFISMPLQHSPKPEALPNRRATLSAGLYGFLEAGLVAVLAAVAIKSFSANVEKLFVALILTAAAASLAWGIGIDRFGPRPTLRLVFLTLALACGATSAAQWLHPGVWVLFASAMAFGVAAGGIYPAGFAWLVEGVAPSQYGYASGLFTRAYGLGSLLGPVAFGLAVEGAGPLGLFGLASLLGAGGWMLARKSSQDWAAAKALETSSS